MKKIISAIMLIAITCGQVFSVLSVGTHLKGVSPEVSPKTCPHRLGESCIRSEQPGESGKILNPTSGVGFGNAAGEAVQGLLRWADVKLDVADPEIAAKLANIVISPDSQRIIILQEPIDGHKAGEEMPLAVACCHVAWALKKEGAWEEFKKAVEAGGDEIEVDELTQAQINEFRQAMHMKDSEKWFLQEAIDQIKEAFPDIEKYLNRLVEIVDMIEAGRTGNEQIALYKAEILQEAKQLYRRFSMKLDMALTTHEFVGPIINIGNNIVNIFYLDRAINGGLFDNDLLDRLSNCKQRIQIIIKMFKRIHEGLRTTPGVTFNITLPEAPEVKVNAVGEKALGEAL